MSVCFILYKLSSGPDCHQGIELSKKKYLPRSMKRPWNRMYKKLEKFPYKVYISSSGCKTKCIEVEEVVYQQGWFLKKRFFKKPYTEIVCTSKTEMENFFKKYIDCKCEDKRSIECVNAFTSAWKDGMIFICSW